LAKRKEGKVIAESWRYTSLTIRCPKCKRTLRVVIGLRGRR